MAVVSGAFALAGFALRHRIPWYVTTFFAVCLIVGALSIRGSQKDATAQTEQLTIDDVGITRTAADLREQVAWVAIARVRIVPTDQGPWLEDVFFIVESKQGQGCTIAHELALRSGLLEGLQSRLKGFNNAAVIEAMGSSENRVFTVWEAEGGA